MILSSPMQRHSKSRRDINKKLTQLSQNTMRGRFSYTWKWTITATTKTRDPKVGLIWENRVAIPCGRECTRPLRVLAVQCALQISPITQPTARYIYTTQTHNDGIYRISIALCGKKYIEFEFGRVLE